MIEVDFSLLFGYDKLQHFLLFLTSSFIFGGIIISTTSFPYVKRNLVCIWFTLLLIGSIEEYRQLFLTNRSAEFLDAVANLLGASIGMVIVLFMIKRKSKTPAKSSLLSLFIFILFPLYIGLWTFNEEPFLIFTK